jgi:hypothetical protein
LAPSGCTQYYYGPTSGCYLFFYIMISCGDHFENVLYLK